MLRREPISAELVSRLNANTVEYMNDGGMGSIRFVGSGPERHLGEVIAEAEYTDDDGVVVSIALNTDTNGRLYEVDFWKVDFSSSPSDLRIKSTAARLS